jgi:hypothetical protein
VTGATGGHLPSVEGQSKLKPRSPAQQTRTPVHTNDKVTDSIVACINSSGCVYFSALLPTINHIASDSPMGLSSSTGEWEPLTSATGELPTTEDNERLADIQGAIQNTIDIARAARRGLQGSMEDTPPLSKTLSPDTRGQTHFPSPTHFQRGAGG